MENAQHNLLIKEDNSLWGAGLANYGQLGNGIRGFINIPKLVELTGVVSEVKNTTYVTYLLMADGSLWGVGADGGGNGIGNGVYGATVNFTEITFPLNADGTKKKIVKLETGRDYFLVKDNEGHIFGYGSNSYGQLGLGNTNWIGYSPVKIFDATENITDFACGADHTLFLKGDGTLLSVGSNGYGQLGNGTTTNSSTLQTVFSAPTIDTDPRPVSFACGNYHSLVLMSDGSAYGFGYNGYGNLAIGNTTNQTSPTLATVNFGASTVDNAKVICSEYSSVIIKDNILYVCGDNGYGKLFSGDSTRYNVFTQTQTNVIKASIGYNHGLILKTDNTVWFAGSSSYGQSGMGDSYMGLAYTAPMQIATNVSAILAGHFMTGIVKEGSAYLFGRNIYGKLALGYNENLLVYEQVATDVHSASIGEFFSIIIKNDKTLWSTGYNDHGQLGLGDKDTRGYFTQVPNMINVKSIVCGRYNAFAILENGDVYATGYNSAGLLGIGTATNPTSFTKCLISNVEKIVTLSSTTLFLTKAGELYSAGSNYYGIYLANGTKDTNTNATPKIIATDVKDIAGTTNSLTIVKKDGTAHSIGYGSYGRLGIGTTEEKLSFVQVGTDTDWDSAYGISDRITLVKKNGDVYSFGMGNSGTLMVNGNPYSPTKVDFTKFLQSDIKQISLQYNFTEILLKNGDVWAYGVNTNGIFNKVTGLNSGTGITPVKIISGIKQILGWVKPLKKYLIQDGTNIKTLTVNGWEILGDTPTETMFLTNGLDSLDDITEQNLKLLETKNPRLLHWTNSVGETSKNSIIHNIPPSQLVLPNGDVDISSIVEIVNITINTTETNNGKVRIVTSIDQGTTWVAWDTLSSSWVNIDITNKSEVGTKGMTSTILNNINSANWRKLTHEPITNADGTTSDVISTKTIRFGYYIEQSELSDVAETDELIANFNMLGKWSKVADVDYHYEYPNPYKLVVQVFKNGDFKINY